MHHHNYLRLLSIILVAVCLQGCAVKKGPLKSDRSANDTLPPPYATKSVKNFSRVVGWDAGQTPQAPEGFTVTRYAEGLENPRWMYMLPNGDMLVAESNSNHPLLERIGAFFIGANNSNNLKHSADRITLFRDTNKDGIPESKEIFLEGLNQPFGMLLLKDWFYVANTDGLWRYPYEAAQTTLKDKGTKIMDLPAGKHNRHWTRNIIASEDGSKIYVAIGSGSNVGEFGMEAEVLKADILEINPDGSGMKVFGSGLRNPVGMGWAPGTKELWTVVNERDELGDNLVPDYLTHVKEGGFYGWPYVYYGHHKDPRVKETPVVAKEAIVPDVPLGSHTASLGLVFYEHDAFPKKYRNGAFVVQHGSWNRATLSGYKVIFIPFDNGKPAGKAESFLTGFVDELASERVKGRPVGAVVGPGGSLYITDDVTGIIWRVSVAEK